MPAVVRAMKLEFSLLAESKPGLLFIIVLPALITAIFSFVGNSPFPLEPEKSFYIFYSPVFFIILILFFAIQQSILRVVGERSPDGTLERDLLAIRPIPMLLGKFLANFILLLLQIGLLVLAVNFIAPVQLGIEVHFTIILVLVGLIGLSTGFLFSVFSPNKDFALQFMPYLILGLFLAQLVMIFPEAGSKETMETARLIPSSLGSEMLKNLVYGKEIVFESYAVLFAWILLPMTIAFIKFNSEKG